MNIHGQTANNCSVRGVYFPSHYNLLIGWRNNQFFGHDAFLCTLKLHTAFYIACIPAQLAQRRLGELIGDLLLPTPPRTWHMPTGVRLKTWRTTINADLEPLTTYLLVLASAFTGAG